MDPYNLGGSPDPQNLVFWGHEIGFLGFTVGPRPAPNEFLWLGGVVSDPTKIFLGAYEGAEVGQDPKNISSRTGLPSEKLGIWGSSWTLKICVLVRGEVPDPKNSFRGMRGLS